MIYRGSSSSFVDALCEEAREHNAVTHRFFEQFNTLSEDQANDVLRDFIFQYSFYSRKFDAYNDAVLSTLSENPHRQVLIENIRDEQGTGERGFRGLPHREMYGRFAARVGVDDFYRKTHQPLVTAKIWSDLFLQKCASSIPGVGLAAISIGTEHIVPTVYKRILQLISISSFSDIEETYFFVLHSECDVSHSQKMVQILYDICRDKDCREAVRFGALSALNLRSSFFDVMNVRVEEIKCRARIGMQRDYMTVLPVSGAEPGHGAYLT